MAGFRVEIDRRPAEIEVTVELDQGKTPIDLARVLARAFVHTGLSVAQVFNTLVKGLSATQNGLRESLDVTLENARPTKGGRHGRGRRRHRW